MPRSSRRPATADGARAPAWPHTWWTLESEPQDGVTNMACDLALLDLAHANGTAVLRTYGWTQPTVSFGRNEPVRGVWDVPALRRDQYDVVRRPTGGRALLHAHEVTYSVVLPLARETPWRWAYDAINQRLREALQALGVPAATVERDHAPTVRPDGPACFAAPAVGELAVGGQKLVGSAVWRTSGAYLQHGAILVHDVQPRLAAYRLASPTSETDASATALDRWLPATDQPLTDRLIATLHAAFGCDGTLRPLMASSPGFSRLPERTAQHATALATPDWLWRR